MGQTASWMVRAPAGTVEDQQGDGTDADALADFGHIFVYGLDADCRHDRCGAGAARLFTLWRRDQFVPGEDCIALLAPSLSQYSFAFNTSIPRNGEGD